MRVFLTGGTGSIGGAVLAECVAAGHEVTGLVRNDGAAQTISAAGATPLSGDISKPDTWIKSAACADVFIHLASTFDDEMAETEPRLIAALVDATKERTTPLRVLYTGGCWLYGQTGSAVAVETSPMNPIPAFKWAADARHDLDSQPNMSCAVLHPAMVYDETGGVFARVIRALKAGRPAPIWGSEHTRWPLIHRDDVAAAYLLLAQSDEIGAFNLVAETGVPVGDIAAALSEQAGVKTRAAVLPPKWVRSRHGPWAEGPMLDQQMRSDRMSDLGWVPRHRDFSAVTYQF